MKRGKNMKKNTISKIIMFIITFALIVCLTTNVFADDALDLTNSLTGGNNTTENTTTDNTTSENTTTEDEVPDITPSPTTPSNTTENATTNTNTNTSTYEESDIPHAGVEDTILMGTAFVVFAVIGVYTFMKLSEYSNI